MRILVTGGNGFIGSYVVNNLRNRRHEVVIFDRWRRPFRDDVDQFTADIKDRESVLSAISEVDGVIHLAALLGTAETVSSPSESILVNILGSLNVFQGCQRFDKPCTYITVGNYWMNNPYSITKTTAERFAWMYNREYATRIAVVRALNAYGPRQKAAPIRKVIPNFILPALADKELIVYGDGQQVMDMIYVADVADIVVRSLLVEHTNYLFDPVRDIDKTPRFDAGTGRRTTIQEIAKMVLRHVGRGHIKNVPMRPGEPDRAVVLGDPETLRPLYGGSLPTFLSLEDGLRESIMYYQKEQEK